MGAAQSNRGGLIQGINNILDRSRNNTVLENAIMIISIIILITSLIYIIILLNKSNLIYYSYKDKPFDLLKERFNKILVNKNDENETLDEKVKLSNGLEYTYSFWLYLEDLKSNNNKNRLVFLRTDENDSGGLNNPNPLVYLKADTSDMIIKVKTQDTDGISNLVDESGNLSNLNTNSCNYITAELKYIPLQRWVNIVINVDNNLLTIYRNSKPVYANFVDETESNGEGCSSLTSIDVTTGDVYIGTNENNKYNGYISNIQFYNYSIKSNKDIENIYNRGPVTKTIADTLNLPNIKLRSPIQFVDGTEENSDN